MVFEKIKKIIIEQIDIEEEKLTPETNLKDDLEIDSLDLFQIINDIEEEFDIKIEDIEAYKTIGDVMSFIESSSK